MAIFDEIKEKASSVAIMAGKKANEAYSATKTKMAIAEKKNYLKTLYRELGEITYNGYKNSDQDLNAIEDKIAEIDLTVEKIEELKSEYRKAMNVTVCPSCNAEIEADANFCPKCGEEIKYDIVEFEE